MHPSIFELVQYARGTLSSQESIAQIKSHLEDCPFCTDVVSEYTTGMKSEEIKATPELEAKIDESIADLRRQALAAKDLVIRFQPKESQDTEFPLAAHGVSKRGTGLESLATMIIDEAGVVVRAYRDHDSKKTYLKAEAEEVQSSRGLMIISPRRLLEVITDDSGYAELPHDIKFDPDNEDWFCRFPAASLTLAPRIFDPNAPKSAVARTLSIGEHGEIQIILEEMNDGLRVGLRLHKLHGETVTGPVRVVIFCGKRNHMVRIDGDQAIEYFMKNPDDAFSIRWYRQ